MGKQRANIEPALGQKSRVCWASTSETLSDVVLMLGHRLRRWPNIKTRSAECLGFVGITLCQTKTMCKRWPYATDVGP